MVLFFSEVLAMVLLFSEVLAMVLFSTSPLLVVGCEGRGLLWDSNPSGEKTPQF